MTLSTQLLRGTLALPLLLMFSVLGLSAGEPAEVDAPGAAVVIPAPAATIAKLKALALLCNSRGSHARVLMLAQAPADLGTLAIRWSEPCRG